MSKLYLIPITLLILIACTPGIQAQALADKVVCTQYQDYILTHTLTPFGPVPTAFDPDCVYPYVSYCETSHRLVLLTVRVNALPDDVMRVL